MAIGDISCKIFGVWETIWAVARLSRTGGTGALFIATGLSLCEHMYFFVLSAGQSARPQAPFAAKEAFYTLFLFEISQ